MAVGDKAIESLIEHPFQALDDPLAGLEGLLPPNLTIPAGWELPTNIPLPPPGWKLGDPITLPPMDAITAPGRTAEQQLRHVAQTGFTKADGPIQVRPVQPKSGFKNTPTRCAGKTWTNS
ncbi:hypothetical protein QQ045_025393 [Rhodiola kirilowii]